MYIYEGVTLDWREDEDFVTLKVVESQDSMPL